MRHGATCWRLSARPMNVQCISPCWRAARLHLTGMVSLLAALALSCYPYDWKLYKACWGHPARPMSAQCINPCCRAARPLPTGTAPLCNYKPLSS